MRDEWITIVLKVRNLQTPELGPIEGAVSS